MVDCGDCGLRVPALQGRVDLGSGSGLYPPLPLAGRHSAPALVWPSEGLFRVVALARPSEGPVPRTR
eukprot:560396-Pyramimonas_sp.AAC.1